MFEPISQLIPREVHPVLGTTHPWRPGMPIAGIADQELIVKVDMFEFISPWGIHGLAHASDEELVLVAVLSDNPGNGNFRRFIAAASQIYTCIRVVEVWNEGLARWLERNGFHFHRWRAPDGEQVACYTWRRA